MNVLHSSKSVEWYTPRWVIELAEAAVRGTFDLDPASCEVANRNVQAKRIYTEEDNGLIQTWKADRLFLNPPYGRGKNAGAKVWIWKLLGERSSGNVKQAVLLVNATPDRKWFRPLWDWPICFLYDRICFEGPNSTGRANPTYGNVLVGFGVDEQRFESALCKHGKVILPRGP